jgi:hypothetical protein
MQYEEYAGSFEPLILLECWEQLRSAKEFIDFSKNGVLQLRDCNTVDEFHGTIH